MYRHLSWDTCLTRHVNYGWKWHVRCHLDQRFNHIIKMTIFLRMPEHGRPLQPVQSLPWSTSRPISVSEPPVFIARGMTGGGGGGSQCLSFGEWGEGGRRILIVLRQNWLDPTFRLCNIHTASISFAWRYTRTVYWKVRYFVSHLQPCWRFG